MRSLVCLIAALAISFSTTSRASGVICSITSPVMNGDLLSPVEITFDGSGAAVSASVLFEYTTGGPLMAATAHMYSALSNPDTVNLPASGVVFTWDASADVAPSTLANFQITIDDGGAPSTCSVSNITVPVELMNFEIY